MELQQLKYFQHVAETQNMNRSARELHISQPALSKSIHRLEEELKQPLFNRQGRNIVLNEYGKIFLKHVISCFYALESSIPEMDAYRRNSEGTITFLVNTALTVLPDLIAGFHKLYPNIKINLWQSGSMPSGSVYDFSLDVSQLPRNDKNHLTLIEESIVLAVYRRHPLANRESIELAELDGESFVSLPQNTTYRQLLDAYCLQAGIRHNVNYEVFNYLNTVEMVKRGVGIALLPEFTWCCTEEKDPELCFIPISRPQCNRYMIFSWSDKKVFSIACQAFYVYLLEYFETAQKKKKLFLT